MNKLIYVMIFCGVVVVPRMTMGATCQVAQCPSNGSGINDFILVDNCEEQEAAQCIGKTKVVSCKVCKEGYSLVDDSRDSSDCGTIYYKNCELSCTSCPTNCLAPKMWQKISNNNGYERRAVSATCNQILCQCEYEYEYRCAANYFGNARHGVQSGYDYYYGCSECPESGKSAAGNTPKTECYIPSGATMSDSVGVFTYTSSCYWVN